MPDMAVAGRTFRPRANWSHAWALTSGLVLSCVATAGVAVWVLADLGGWIYYLTPLGVRGYAAAHALLRPSGRIGHALGIVGFVMMLVPVAYSARKKWPRLHAFGSLRTWLEVHLFCGVFGPVLVTFHTAWKFNGLIAVAYWSMVAVVLSGFVGRYFYVRIPKTIRGAELTHDEILARATELRAELSLTALPDEVLRGLSNEFVERLPPDVRERVRARRSK